MRGLFAALQRWHLLVSQPAAQLTQGSGQSWGVAVMARQLLLAIGVDWAMVLSYCQQVGGRPMNIRVKSLTTNVAAWVNSITDAEYLLLADVCESVVPKTRAALGQVCEAASTSTTQNNAKVVAAVNSLLMAAVGVKLGDLFSIGKPPNKRRFRPLCLKLYIMARDDYRCRAFAGAWH